MAEAEKHEEVRVTEEFVTLKLSMDEAKALYVTGKHVGGSPGDQSPRGHIDSIRDAVKKACYFPGWADQVDHLVDRLSASGVYFRDYPEATK